MYNEDKNLAFDSYRNAFYRVRGENGYFLKDKNGSIPGERDFWRVCEEIEAVEDAYDRSGADDYRTMVGQLLNGLNRVVSGTTDFASWNEFNDDVMWAVIALARGYEITGERTFLDQAMEQFNAVWDRAWDDQLGGGLWWRGDKQTKNACVQGPAAIAAMILARNTQNTGYRAQADRIYNWLRSTLYNPDNGQVADHIQSDGKKVWWEFTYNQGAFAGAAVLLYEATGNSDYLKDASDAVNWTRNNLTGQHVNGILNDEYQSNGKGGDDDSVGFKGVFVRWATKYANVSNDHTIKNWLTVNAKAAWQNRNSFGVTWGQWWRRTPDDYVTSWECSSALAIIQCAP